MHRLTKSQLKKRQRRRWSIKPVKMYWRIYCKECSQTIPQNFAYKGKYMSDEEHFCSLACQEAFEEEFKPLPMMREAGL